jgi:hypothetical protein
VYKLITLVKRKPGMSKQRFKDYYENHHSKLGEKYLPPFCKKYLHRYLESVPHPMKRGIALPLAEEGATVYMTGRTVAQGAYHLLGTVCATAEEEQRWADGPKSCDWHSRLEE